MEHIDEIGPLWMLTETLGFQTPPPPKHRDTFIKAVLICARAEGELAQSEREWVAGRFTSFFSDGYDLAMTYEADEDLADVLEECPDISQNSARAMIYIAIQASYADGEFHPREREAIKKLAARIHVAPEVVDLLEDQHLEEVKIRERRLELLFPEGVPY